MTKRLRDLLRTLPRQSQRGFTLIEMLVVISILGILAAVVTMSMVGVTKIAQDRANAAEKKTVQVALDTMAAEQQLDSGSVCDESYPASNDMQNWPAPKGADSSVGHRVPLYPNFLRQENTAQTYTCTANGEVKVAGS